MIFTAGLTIVISIKLNTVQKYEYNIYHAGHTSAAFYHSGRKKFSGLIKVPLFGFFLEAPIQNEIELKKKK